MKKNDFWERYNSALWCGVAALWFFVDYIFMEPRVNDILISGCFWIVFAVYEAIRCYRKNK